MQTARIDTTEGAFIATFSERGLKLLEFPRKSGHRPLAGLAVTPGIARWHKLTARALHRILSGRAPGRLPPLDLAGATDFQRRVWAALQRIPPGRTRTYAQIAQAVGRPAAVRAVGNACGANPIPVLIPCHRVVCTGGGLGGFGGGLDWKCRLLEREGARAAENRV
jgi:O-6-methylguanine DNA methyltransferase